MSTEQESVKVYLDYNIIRYLQEGRITIEQIREKLNITNEIVFPFSASHIQEIDNISDSNPDRDKIITERVAFINTLSKGHYLYSKLEEPNRLYWKTTDAFEVLETIREVPFAKSAMKNLSNFVNESQRKSVREMLGVDSKEVNNYTVTEVLGHLEKMAGMANMTFVEFMAKAKSFHKYSHTFGFHNDVAGVFEMLDMVGYWKDAYKQDSNYARLWDSSHCAFGAYCDLLITNDRNTANKSQVVYTMYEVSTQIILWR